MFVQFQSIEVPVTQNVFTNGGVKWLIITDQEKRLTIMTLPERVILAHLLGLLKVLGCI